MNSPRFMEAKMENGVICTQSSSSRSSSTLNKASRNVGARARTMLVLGAAFVLFITHSYIFGFESFSDFRPFLEVERAQEHQHSDAGICMTPACIHASSEILYNLSPNRQNVDPCDNFEEFVCGGWKDRHDLRPDQGHMFTGNEMVETSETLLRHVLEAPYPKLSAHSYFSPAQLGTSSSSADEQNFDKLKAAYDACLNEDTIKKAGAAPLMDILRTVSHTFSTAESTSGLNGAKKSALADTISHLVQLRVPSLVMPSTGADDKDPDTVVISVAPPYQIGLPAKELYKDTTVLSKYETVLSEVVSGLYPDEHFPNGTFHAVIEFEKELASASPDAQDRGDVTKYYNPMSLKEADALAPRIGLSQIIKSLAPADFKVDRLIVMSPSYMNDVENILSKTSKDVQHIYFLWKVIQVYYSRVESDALSSYERFEKELSGRDPDSKTERWRTCIRHVDGGLGWILSRFFIEKAFSAKAKDFGDQIVLDIKSRFIDTLKSTRWMEKAVTELAISKVRNIVQKIGYPTTSPDIMDPSTLRKYYDSVDISPSTFFNNSLSMNQFEARLQWSALGKPVDRDEWGMTASTVNAYYNPPGNEIVFPAGIMQFPVFDVDLPAYLSYGAFGSVSGHELSHAFDSTGRHYDQNGNYTDWWTNSTVENFKSRAECFVEQYSNFTLEGTNDKTLHVNGRLTLGENIADAGGVSAAFSAWKQRAAEKPNQHLPGLEAFSQEQLFFVSYGSWWCSKSTKEVAENRAYTDPHAPEWARILGTMANSRPFHDSFQCKQKEPVCELW